MRPVPDPAIRPASVGRRRRGPTRRHHRVCTASSVTGRSPPATCPPTACWSAVSAAMRQTDHLNQPCSTPTLAVMPSASPLHVVLRVSPTLTSRQRIEIPYEAPTDRTGGARSTDHRWTRYTEMPCDPMGREAIGVGVTYGNRKNGRSAWEVTMQGRTRQGSAPQPST